LSPPWRARTGLLDAFDRAVDANGHEPSPERRPRRTGGRAPDRTGGAVRTLNAASPRPPSLSSRSCRR